MTWRDAGALLILGGAFAGLHTVCITLPFYRRSCPTCGRAGFSRCDRAKHDLAHVSR